MVKFIELEREGIEIDRDVLKRVLACYVEMGKTNSLIKKINEEGGTTKFVVEGKDNLENYVNFFETEFLRKTDEYFKTKAKQMMNNLSTHDYVLEADRLLNSEEERANSILNNSTKPKMLETILETILKDKAKQLADCPGAGIESMFKNEQKD